MMLYYLFIATQFGGVFDIVIDRSVKSPNFALPSHEFNTLMSVKLPFIQ